MAVEEGSISDGKLAAINTARQQILGRCEFKDMADADVLSLPLTLTKAHVTTWCLGELPINEDAQIMRHDVSPTPWPRPRAE